MIFRNLFISTPPLNVHIVCSVLLNKILRILQKSKEMLLSKRFDDKELSRDYVDSRPGYDSTVLEKILEYMKGLVSIFYLFAL